MTNPTPPHLLRKGIYRTKRPEGMDDDAQVEDVNGGSETTLDESIYRQRGYLPPFNELPWSDDYFAAKAKPKPDVE